MSPWLDLRLLVIAACGGSAGIHAGLAPHHWEESRAFGVLFVLAAVNLAGVATAGLFCSLIAAFVAADEPLDALVVTTKAIEAAGLVLALVLLRRPPSRPASPEKSGSGESAPAGGPAVRTHLYFRRLKLL